MLGLGKTATVLLAVIASGVSPFDLTALQFAVVGPDDLFIEAEVGKTRVYQNEPIAVSYRLFTRVYVTSYRVVDLGESEGFWVEEVPGPENPPVGTRVREGRSLAVRRMVLFPAGPGIKTIEQLSVEARVLAWRLHGLLELPQIS